MASISDYTSIESGLFYKWQWQENFTSLSRNSTWAFSDYNSYVTIGGLEYTPLDKVIGLSSSTIDLNGNDNTTTLTLTGVGRLGAETTTYYDGKNDQLKFFLNNTLVKQSKLTVFRAFFDSETKQLIEFDDIANPVGRFVGFCTTYGITESHDAATGEGTVTITMEFASYKESLKIRKGGRRTDPQFGYEFKRLPGLVDKPLDWGAT